MKDENNKQPGLSWSTPSHSPLVPAAAPAKSAQKQDAKPTGEAVSALKRHNTQAPVYAGMLVGGIIVGVLLSTAWSSLKKESSLVASTETSTVAAVAGATDSTESSEAVASSLPFSVEDQSAGASVTVTKLALQKPAWVVVYANRDGKPGNALGARLFFAADKQGKVALLRNTAAGQTYFVGLSIDNGDKIFSLKADARATDENGEVLWATFKAR